MGNPIGAGEIEQGVSDYGALLVNGTIFPREDDEIHPRTLVGTGKEGRFVLFVVADGRQSGYSEVISLYEAAVLMQEHGCQDAVNQDGGGSSIMLISRGDRLVVVNRPSGGDPRPIPVMLAVRKLAGKE